MTGSLWGAVIAAGVLALAAPLGLRPLLHRLGIFDVPNHRSSHSRPTLRGGGVALLLGVLAGGTWATVALEGTAALFAGVVVGAGLIAGLVGFAEDLRGLRVVVRAGLQFLIGGAVAAVLGSITGIHWLWVPVAALFFAAHVNFTNFMDGINGISGFHGLVVGLAYAGLGLIHDVPWLMVIGLITAVAFAAFLPWNLISPGMFLGDVGSYLLGGIVGATAIAALVAGIHPVAALAPLVIYWADTVTTLFRRAARGEPVFEAHRTHAYQRLTNTGLSHVAVALIVSGFTAASAGVGLGIATATIHWAPGGLIVLGLAVAYLFLPRLRGDVLPAPASDDFAAVPVPSPIPPREGWEPVEWAVIGATGFIGRALTAHLVKEGLRVRAIAGPRLELDPDLRDGAEVAKIATAHPAVVALAEQLTGVDVVVNAAGMATPDGPADSKLFGANALLPAVAAEASARASVGRFLHLSSAAVQGDRPVLDAFPDVSPFSPYSRSKALGERALLASPAGLAARTDIVIVRATSVQGSGRATTEALRRVARSPLASVAAPGDHPSVVSSVEGLVRFVQQLGAARSQLPRIALQPWEGLNVREVLELAGGRRPVVLPAWMCRALVGCGKAVGRILPGVAGLVRRVEVMWFGQSQERVTVPATSQQPDRSMVSTVLKGEQISA